MRDRENLHKILERKAELAVRGEKLAQQRLYEAEADVEVRHQENHARDCQETEELRIICCEEVNRARQARIDELSTHQDRNPTTVSQFLTHIQELVNSLSDTMEFDDPESWSSSGATHVPGQTPAIPSPESGRAAILDCRVIHKIVWVLQETFLNDHLLKKDDPLQSSTIQRIWRHPPRK